jgi:hypothetical protein
MCPVQKVCRIMGVQKFKKCRCPQLSQIFINLLTFKLVALGGLVVACLTLVSKVTGSIPARGALDF